MNLRQHLSEIKDALSDVPASLWGLALLPRLILFFSAGIDPSRCLRSDSTGYFALAAHLLHFNFSANTISGIVPETFRTPGYPLFLAIFTAAFRSPILPAAAVQCILGLLSVAVSWRWYKKLSGPRGAFIGASVMALDPVLLVHTPLIMTEMVFTFLLVWASFEYWQSIRSPVSMTRAIYCGFLWSLTAMVRPISVYLPPLLCWIYWKEKKLLLLFLASAYLLPAVWTARNWRATGYPVFSAIGPHDLLRYPAAGVESLRTGRPWSELDVELRNQIDRQHPNGYPNDVERGREYAKAAGPILKAHPFLLAEYAFWGSIKVLAGTGAEMVLEWFGGTQGNASAGEFRPNVTGQGTRKLLMEHPLLIPYQLLYMAALASLYVFFGAGLRILWKTGRKIECVLLSVCFAYFLGLASTQGYYRFRIPLLPFLGAGVAAAIGEKRSSGRATS